MSLVLRSNNLPARHPDKGKIPRKEIQAELLRLTDGATTLNIQQGAHIGTADLGPLDDGWVLYRGLDPALPILVDTRQVEVLGQVSLQAYPATDVGSWGAGPSVMTPGILHMLRLRPHGAGRRGFWLANSHYVASVTRPVDNEEERIARDLRRALWDREAAQFVKAADTLRRVVALGDFNAPKKYSGFDRIVAAGFFITQDGPTHENGGMIDHAVYRGVPVLSSRLLKKGPSDHTPIELVVSL